VTRLQVAARWHVAGEVQGVGFRWFVAREAERLGLRGWARNLADGSVEVVAAGEEAGLEELHRRLAIGPRLARVESVEKVDIPHQGVDVKSFDIR
jgi:acylphosphatase